MTTAVTQQNDECYTKDDLKRIVKAISRHKGCRVVDNKRQILVCDKRNSSSLMAWMRILAPTLGGIVTILVKDALGKQKKE